MKRLALAAAVLVLALVAFGTLSCQEESAVPEPTAAPSATPTWPEVSKDCDGAARQATQAKFGIDSFKESTDDFTEFEQKVEEVGDPYGVPYLFFSAWFKDYYERLFGRSPLKYPEASEFYESQDDNCIREKGLKPEDNPLDLEELMAPSTEEQAIIECVATLIIETEKEFREGSVGYSTAYRNFANNRPVCEGENVSEGVDLVANEKLYEEVTGRSPFVNAEAMASFRAKAKNCPE
jgi:hypothetical protein